MGEDLVLPENTHLRFDLRWVILFILYMPCFERCKDKKNPKKTRHETSQNAPRTCTSSWLYSHPLVYSISFSFLSGLLSLTRSDSNLNLYRYLSIPFTSENTTPSLLFPCSTSVNLLHLPPQKWYNYHHQSFPIFPPFLCVSSSGSDNFTVSSHQDHPILSTHCFQRRLYVLKNPNTIAASVILKN